MSGEQADVIREALEFMRDCGDRPGMYEEAEAALAALASLKAEHDEAITARDERREMYVVMVNLKDAAEARVAELETREAELLSVIEEIRTERDRLADSNWCYRSKGAT